jgi:ABC-2 type transport system permease protein
MPINPAIFGLTVRQLLARRRALLILLLAVVPLVMAGIYRNRQIDTPAEQAALARRDSLLADSIVRDSVKADSVYKALLTVDTARARRDAERAERIRAIRRRNAEPPPTPQQFAAQLLTELVVTVLLPLVALVFGSGVFGAEIDDGTAIYIFSKPIPRWHLVLTKWIVASLATALVVVPATLAAGAIVFGGLDAQRMVLGFAAGVAAGGVVYCAVFVALSLATRRALIAGLLYVVVWEGLLAAQFAGTRVLSVRQFAYGVADHVTRVDTAIFEAALAARTAAWMCVAVTLLALAVAVAKLRTFEVGKEA